MGALLNMPLCLLCKLYGLVEQLYIYCLSPSKCSIKKYFDILFLSVCIFSFYFNQPFLSISINCKVPLSPTNSGRPSLKICLAHTKSWKGLSPRKSTNSTRPSSSVHCGRETIHWGLLNEWPVRVQRRLKLLLGWLNSLKRSQKSTI